ncbi:MAG: Rieske (2Fe-2S) protein [Phycisphaeraceae bacterium]|nr:Rieske (2Fe-2S) protein [Phycisphaeraceae bacterium]
MANWHPTINETELTDQAPQAVMVEGESIVLCKHNGQVQAFVNSCPHAGLPLDGGDVTDGVLTCPFHGYTFDLCSGQNTVFGTDQPLKRCPVRVVDGKVEIEA